MPLFGRKKSAKTDPQKQPEQNPVVTKTKEQLDEEALNEFTRNVESPFTPLFKSIAAAQQLDLDKRHILIKTIINVIPDKDVNSRIEKLSLQHTEMWLTAMPKQKNNQSESNYRISVKAKLSNYEQAIKDIPVPQQSSYWSNNKFTYPKIYQAILKGVIDSKNVEDGMLNTFLALFLDDMDVKSKLRNKKEEQSFDAFCSVLRIPIQEASSSTEKEKQIATSNKKDKDHGNAKRKKNKRNNAKQVPIAQDVEERTEKETEQATSNSVEKRKEENDTTAKGETTISNEEMKKDEEEKQSTAAVSETQITNTSTTQTSLQPEVQTEDAKSKTDVKPEETTTEQVQENLLVKEDKSSSTTQIFSTPPVAAEAIATITTENVNFISNTQEQKQEEPTLTLSSQSETETSHAAVTSALNAIDIQSPSNSVNSISSFDVKRENEEEINERLGILKQKLTQAKIPIKPGDFDSKCPKRDVYDKVGVKEYHESWGITRFFSRVFTKINEDIDAYHRQQIRAAILSLQSAVKTAFKDQVDILSLGLVENKESLDGFKKRLENIRPLTEVAGVIYALAQVENAISAAEKDMNVFFDDGNKKKVKTYKELVEQINKNVTTLDEQHPTGIAGQLKRLKDDCNRHATWVMELLKPPIPREQFQSPITQPSNSVVAFPVPPAVVSFPTNAVVPTHVM